MLPLPTEFDEVAVFTIPAAIRLLDAMAKDSEFSAVEHERAHILQAWLETQGDGV